uniref:Uncharacterized protein n=1 Tax=Anguilla anguilla TaxID=7936 RepID=A0A0E9U9X9_ANGAN
MWAPMLGLTALPHLGGICGAFITRKEVKTWYPTLKKPSWRPPNGAFGVVWTGLYTGMGVCVVPGVEGAGGGSSRKRPRSFGPVRPAVGLNWAWTPSFLGHTK